MSRKLSANAPCPCGRETKYKRCCRPVHQGQRAPTPEALMRSRFSAYALGLVDHQVATTHPEGRDPDPDRQRASIETFCQSTRFVALEVYAASADGDRGEVSFWARLEQGGRDASFGERSVFERVDGRWLYRWGQRIPRGVG